MHMQLRVNIDVIELVKFALYVFGVIALIYLILFLRDMRRVVRQLKMTLQNVNATTVRVNNLTAKTERLVDSMESLFQKGGILSLVGKLFGQTTGIFGKKQKNKKQEVKRNG